MGQQTYQSGGAAASSDPATSELYLFAGMGINATHSPQGCALGYIKTYKFINEGRELQLLHSTSCEDIPYAFNQCAGKLVAGIGNIVRIYDLGQKKLLKKQENRRFVSNITAIRVVNETGRIYAADLSNSVHVLKFNPDDS